MNLLILTPYIPYPINSGGNQAFFGLVDKLRQHINISILFIERDGDQENIAQLQSVWPNVKFMLYQDKQGEKKAANKAYFHILNKINASTSRKINRMTASAYSEDDAVRKYSSLYNNYYTPLSAEYVEYVDSVLKRMHFDLIQVDFFELITIANILPKGIKKVFVHHELRRAKCLCEYSIIKNPNAMDKYLLEYSNNFELQHLRQYDGVITLTDTDKSKLDAVMDKNKVYTSPPIINIENTRNIAPFEPSNKIVFLGGCHHYPNIDGLEWFLSSCWENILQEAPDAELHIIGKWNSKWQKRFARENQRNITFCGYIENLSEYLRNKIMIVPIRIGSGIRIKALDGIANGCPVVSTAVGIEGMNLVDGKDCLISDGAATFSNSVLKLMKDITLSKSLQSNARKKLEMYASSEKLVQCRLDIYKKILFT